MQPLITLGTQGKLQGVDWQVVGFQRRTGVDPSAVSYTHLDVYKRQGTHKLSTQTLPVLTYLKNWDKLFESPFKSDVYFFSTRQQIDQKWGTPQPITIRDKDFGAVRLRAFGNFHYRIADPKLFHTELSGTREAYTTTALDGQLPGLVLHNISNAIASSGIAFLDRASNQLSFAQALTAQLLPEFAKLGLKLEGMTCLLYTSRCV